MSSVDATAAAIASATLAFVVAQTWKCLCVPTTMKQSIFRKVFFNEDVLFEIASSADIMFCPGLLDVVQSPTPPDISFFKNVPPKYLGVWGIYCLVLEKAGCTPVVYIGEGSEKSEGIRSRWRNYDNPHTKANRKLLPSKVREFLDDGYKITHKGTLAYYRIPDFKDRPRIRVLNYAVEAMFSFAFWTMFSKTKDYQIGSCCLWDRKTITYGGLCSHSSLNDPVRAKLNLTPKELKELEAEAKIAEQYGSRHNSYYHISLARNRLTKELYCHVCGVAFARRSRQLEHNKTPGHIRCVKLASEGQVEKFRCEPCDQGFPTFEALRSHQKTSAHMNVVMPPNEIPVRQSLWCDICGIMCLTAKKLEVHNKSSNHLSRVEKIAAGVDMNKYRCDVCDRGFDTANYLASHNKSTYHKKKVEEVAKAEASPPVIPTVVEGDAKSERHCYICNQPCESAWEFARHNNSKKHLKRVANIAAGVDYNKFRCDVCNKGFADVWALKTHDKGQRHKAKVAELQEAEEEEDDY